MSPLTDTSKVRAAVIASQPLNQQVVSQWLNQVSPGCTIRIFTDLKVLLEAQTEDFDAVVFGQYLYTAPDPKMLTTVGRLSQQTGAAAVIVVTAVNSADLVSEAVRQGVRGYVSIDMPLPVAVAAVRLILVGGTFVPPIVSSDRQPESVPMLEAPPTELPEELAHMLSDRERQVLALLRTGSSNRRIAAALDISENTVMVHVRHLMRKLGATNRTEAVFKASQGG